MIYHQNKFVDWNKSTGLNDIEKQVKKGIEEIREKYFKEGDPEEKKVVKFYDQNGARTQNVSGHWEPRKPFPLKFTGGRGEWRYTPTMPGLDKNGQPMFTESCKIMSEICYVREDEIELAYFLINHNPSVKSGRIKIIDDEKDAQEKADSYSDDLDLRYHLYGKASPVANDRNLLDDIASTFGVKDVESLGLAQLKNRIYDVVVSGDKSRNRFINTKEFMSLIDNEGKRQVAQVVYRAVKNGDLKYSNKTYGYHFVEGGVMGEKIIDIAGKDESSAVQILINECANNEKVRNDIYGYLGIKVDKMVESYRDKGILELKNIAKERELKFNWTTIKKEELVKLLCEAEGTNYEKPILA